MKKKIIIGVVICVVLVACVVGFLLTREDDTPTLVTMDVNPSLELIVVKNIITDIHALNGDGNDVVTDNIKDKKLEDGINIIVDNMIQSGYITDNNVVVILGVDGKASVDDIQDVISKSFLEHDHHADIIVPEITEEAKNRASQYGISAAKAAYISEVVKSNDLLSFENLVEKPTSELNEMKQTGHYCDPGYTLDGDSCLKKIREEKPQEDNVCPQGSEEVDGNCYKSVGTTSEAYCDNGTKLENGKCVGETKVDATAKCSTGTYNSKTGNCEVLTYTSAGTKSCREADDLLLDNGKCASAHPGAHSYGEPGEIDPATECCCGDTYHVSPNPNSPSQGWCYSLPNGNYDATVTCPSGSVLSNGSNGQGCYTATTSNATYSCSEGTLSGNKCIINKPQQPKTKMVCASGYELYRDRVCINKSETIDYIEGYKCTDDNAKLQGNVCVVYEIIDAK